MNKKKRAKPIGQERSFFYVDNDFLDDETLSCEEKMVYIVLQSFRGNYDKKTGALCVPMETISKCSGMSINRAKRTIDRLIEDGYVTRTRPGTATTNIYTIIDRTKGRAKNE